MGDVERVQPELPDWYMFVLVSMGGVHVLLSVIILVEYFLSNRPQFPSVYEMRQAISNLLGEDFFAPPPDDENDDEHLRVNFFSLKTFYYLLFLGASCAGVAFWGYFFCFHMLHIVPRNQMLMRVLKSVTQNGTSLIWVGILGLVIIWIYAVPASPLSDMPSREQTGCTVRTWDSVLSLVYDTVYWTGFTITCRCPQTIRTSNTMPFGIFTMCLSTSYLSPFS